MTSEAKRPSSIPQINNRMLRALRNSFASSLSEFTSPGPKNAFRIVHSIPESKSGRNPTVKTLYVLDSSFNPPTKAHMHLARSALKEDRGIKPVRLLLLLAIKNADKMPKPAKFEDRLVMMTLMAEELHSEMSEVVVDVGITNEPFYYKKVEVVDASETYGGLKAGVQVHITGFDTIVRIFDKRYYPDGMDVLEPFFRKGRLRVHLRDGDEKEQREYMESVKTGGRENDGIKSIWADSIEIEDPLEDAVSSTEARRCVAEKMGEGLERYVGENVKEFILTEGLYTEEILVKESGEAD